VPYPTLGTIYKRLAAAYPEPPNKRKFIIESLYNCEYENAKPMSWSWPANGKAK